MMEICSSYNHCIFLVIYLLKKKNTRNYNFETLNLKVFSGAAYLPDPPNVECLCRSNLTFLSCVHLQNLTLRPCLIVNFNSTAMLAHVLLQ